jgi:hypothetical protein
MLRLLRLSSTFSMLLKPGVALSLTSNGAGRRTLNQPTKFDLVIDFMIAKALGLTVPRSRCSAAPTG